MRDGRLAGAERASYERHVTGCAACAREVRALESLAAALRADPPAHEEADELHVRREKTRLLAAFDGALVAPEARGPRRWVLGVAAAGAVLAGLAVLWRARSARPAAQDSRVAVHADGSAVWSERREGDREKLLLERGALWIHVDHAPGEEGRLVVVLPDGELEDIGTTFTIRAEDGRTKRVTVEEGKVLLRLRDRPALTIGSGETWVADVPAPVACASVAPSTEPPAPARPVEARSAAPLRSSPPAASAQEPDPSPEFRAAMSALDVGDDGEAAARFGSFLQRHPHDPRAEDAAYLRVIALQRSGDTAGMKEAATTYLRLYPAGFRRAEVEPLTR
jgi:hypothetical protein